MGWPLGYSLSPLMHGWALKAAGLQGEYKEYPVEPSMLELWLGGVVGMGLSGFNVTMPYKNQVWNWLKNRAKQGQVAPEADDIGAVNTVVVKNDSLIGYNTDGEGFLSAFHDAGLDLSGWRVLLLGSGGAAQAIAYALAKRTVVSHLTVWNRPGALLERAGNLVRLINRVRPAEEFAALSTDLEALAVQEYPLIINATPLGMKGHVEVPETVLKRIHQGQVVYDIVYEPRETGMIRAARKAGARAITGDVMLAGQGAVAFELWTGRQWMQPVMQQALNEHFARH